LSYKLSAELILQAYGQGIFPMGSENEISWYSPDPRFIISLAKFHTPRRLVRKLKQKCFDIRINTAWDGVIQGCAERETTWITDDIIIAYTELHALGYGHSVEAFIDEKLVGGLYGVSLGGAFMAESMFHRVSDASKACLVYLVERLNARGFILLDAQFLSEKTGYLKNFGGIEIPRSQYLQILSHALTLNCSFDSY
jgi:leucyl/phenylalanyl-tRNA---protein transferase